MSNVKSDAFVFFGATGDLAYKKIFPALQAMAKRGHLDVPVVGVAKAGWGLDEFRARARDSVEQHGDSVAGGSIPPVASCATAAGPTEPPPPSRAYRNKLVPLTAPATIPPVRPT